MRNKGVSARVGGSVEREFPKWNAKGQSVVKEPAGCGLAAAEKQSYYSICVKLT